MLGAVLTMVCGLVLWGMPFGDPWINASYDYLFLFGSRMPTNKVALILMDPPAHRVLGQNWDQPWKRSLHTQLLKKLTEDKCPLVVFDVFFIKETEEAEDSALAKAILRQGHVVLASKVDEPKHPGARILEPSPPLKLFLDAAADLGVGKADGKPGGTPRRHWPFPASSEGHFQSLPWAAARQAGARLDQKPQYQWLRYYGENGPWAAFSYHFALSNAPSYFGDKIVFVGKTPLTPTPVDEKDVFSTPYTRWTDRPVGGVEIMATEFLNLMNGDWLRRAPGWAEALLLVVVGLSLGGGLYRTRPLAAWGLALMAALAVTFGAVSLSYYTNYWFPWLVIVGGQVPCALACSVVASQVRRKPQPIPETIVVDGLAEADRVAELPDTPDYELFDPPFGQGAYGKVWLARNAIGQWQALKAVYLARFGPHPEPYDREFNGIKRYKPISDKHPGLLRVDFVSTRKEAGYFYYVMELGDALEPGWEQAPATYKPRDLASMRSRSPERRLPLEECIRIGLGLAEALDFLHRQGLTHRDIKPQNIIFVNGRPKLADVGLTAELLPTNAERTWVGTPGYMPPPPEPPGTQQADIYGLGMVLYVIRTGREPDLFPAVSTTLVEGTGQMEFIQLNAVILKACQPDRALRFSSAAQMHAALLEVQRGLHLEERTSPG